ncbi:MAG: GNAT family N-acetyltransferase [Myxococcota bacterium]
MIAYQDTLDADFWRHRIRPGARVFVGSNAATPHGLLDAMLEHYKVLTDVEMVHILTVGGAPWADRRYQDHVRTNSLFLGPGSREAVQRGDAEYTPCFLSEVPGLFLDEVLPIDVALVQVAPPDEHGYCSLGVSVDVVSAACRAARVVIAQVNPRMPRTLGQSFVHLRDIDVLWEHEAGIPEIDPPDLDDATLRIGRHVSLLIDDEATLQMGIGKIPDAVLRNLGDRRDLGVHTEMFSDGLLDLYDKGVVTNARKGIHPGKTITSFCMGTRALYDFVDDNPHVEFHPSEYVNNPVNIAKNHKMVSINSAIEVDLTGQVAADSIGTRFYSGIGGQVDFIRGAVMCPGGRPIIALPSTAKGGEVSRIVPTLTKGGGVVTSRGDVHYVVTEYGIATLRGRSIRERALELIQVAHPKFRDELLSDVRSFHWVPAYTEREPTRVRELGGVQVSRMERGDRVFFLRPLQTSDERRLQEFFYSHTEETLLQRYRHRPRAMSRERAHRLVNVDQTRDLALCILERQGPREVIHAIGRWFVDDDGSGAEIAFVVRESMRGRGMASRLVRTMLHVARKRGVPKLYAIVRLDNLPMIRVLEHFGFEAHTTDDPFEACYEVRPDDVALDAELDALHR